VAGGARGGGGGRAAGPWPDGAPRGGARPHLVVRGTTGVPR
jgi:hypothetical protein